MTPWGTYRKVAIDINFLFSSFSYWMFSIFQGDFEIVPSNGDLTTKKPLDHERIGYYELTVIAKDHGKPMMSSSAIIRIHVLDINDNAPIFAPFNSSVVSEVCLPHQSREIHKTAFSEFTLNEVETL